MSVHPGFLVALSPRVLLPEFAAGLPVPHRKTAVASPSAGHRGAAALAPAFPLALSGPSIMFARHAGNVLSSRPGSAASGRDRSGLWLRNAAAGLCVLAAAAATVGFTAQYRMVDATRHLTLVAGLEAAIPDAAALVFASLGIALALHGRRAIRARTLNLAAVGTSVFMKTAPEPFAQDMPDAVILPASDRKTMLIALDIAADDMRDRVEMCTDCPDQSCPSCQSRLRDARAYDQLADRMHQTAEAAPPAHHGQAKPADPARQPRLAVDKEAGQ